MNRALGEFTTPRAAVLLAVEGFGGEVAKGSCCATWVSGSELDAWGLGNLESRSPCHSLMSYLKSKSLNSQ